MASVVHGTPDCLEKPTDKTWMAIRLGFLVEPMLVYHQKTSWYGTVSAKDTLGETVARGWIIAMPTNVQHCAPSWSLVQQVDYFEENPGSQTDFKDSLSLLLISKHSQRLLRHWSKCSSFTL